MTLQALLVSKDDETSALLGSVLCEFGLGVQCCGYLDAICRVTEQKFDAVIVDYDDPHSAATALLKRERRRAFRVPVQVPVEVRVQNGANMEGILLDLSEDGMDVLTAQPLYPSAPVSARFVLPNTDTEVEPRGEVAWANPNGQSGVRFVDLPENLRAKLKAWVTANSPQLPPEDPEPVSDCKLTDLSLGGCYVETDSPFP